MTLSLPHPNKPPARAVFSFLDTTLPSVDPLDPVSILPFLQKHSLGRVFPAFWPFCQLQGGGRSSGLARRTTTPERGWQFANSPNQHSGSWRSHGSATLALSPRGHASKRGARRRRLCRSPLMALPLSLQNRLLRLSVSCAVYRLSAPLISVTVTTIINLHQFVTLGLKSASKWARVVDVGARHERTGPQH